MKAICTKAVIPVAGFGTRMLPAARAVPKELLPIVDRPVIQYVVQEAVDAGLDDLLLVTHPKKRAIEEHFAADAELERRLQAAGRSELLASIQSLRGRMKLSAVMQDMPRGLGDAVLQAREFVGADPFLVMLGDAIFSGEPSPAAQLVEAANSLGTAVIGLEEVDGGKVDRYGIAAGPQVSIGIIRIETLVEKPAVGNAPSRLAIAARYLLTPDIFDCLHRTSPGKDGEIQLTDALRNYVQSHPLHGVILKARRHDVGNPIDWLAANLAMARRRPEVWEKLQPSLRREILRDLC